MAICRDALYPFQISFSATYFNANILDIDIFHLVLICSKQQHACYQQLFITLRPMTHLKVIVALYLIKTTNIDKLW